MKIAGNAFKDNADELKGFYNLSSAPSTKQLLLWRATDANGGYVANTFFVNGGPYRTMVDFTAAQLAATPPLYEFKAVSQGSQCGQYVMPAGTNFINKNGVVANANWFSFGLLISKYRLTVNVNALPTQGTSAHICYVKMERNIRLFYGLIGTGWVTTNSPASRMSPSNSIPWDCVPGGTSSASGRAGNFSNYSVYPYSSKDWYISNPVKGILTPAVLAITGSFVKTYIDIPFSQDIFTTVPINSSLDIVNTTINTFNQNYVFPINGLSGSRALKYIAQEKFTASNTTSSQVYYNLEHTDFSTRNAKWIYSQMQNISSDGTCDILDCYAVSMTEAATCSGIRKYSLTNIPSTSAVTWTALPSTGYQLITSGNSATIYCNQNLSIALTANYTDYCGTVQSITRSFVFSLHTATLNTIITDNTTSNWCAGVAHTLTIPAQNQLETYNWLVPSPLFTVLSSTGNNAQILYNGVGNTNANIQCNITSYCYKPATVNFTVPLLKMGDNITKTIQAELIGQSTLQTVNNIADNNATVQILVPSNPNNVAVYSLLNGQPEAFGYFGNGSGLNTNVMSIYNRSGGSYNITASVLNGCNTQVIIPFTINLTNARYNYPFIFTIEPNPVLSSTTVTVNLQNISNSVLQSCLLSGGNIRVEVFNFNTGLLVNTINAPALATSVAVNMNGYAAGLYTFRITGLNCAGFYQEVQQVIKQ